MKKFKLDRFQWLLWGGFMVEFTYAFAFTQYNTIPFVLLYFVLAAAVSFGSVHLWTLVTAARRSDMLFWLPGVCLMLFANLVFHYNAVLPFVLCSTTCTVGAAMASMSEQVGKKGATVPGILLAGVCSFVGYFVLTCAYGVFS